MSLDDFLERKSKKKSRKTLNTKDLYEKIIDNNPPPKNETEKANEELLPKDTADNDWEPIQNEFPDIAPLGLVDMGDEDEEGEASATNSAKDAPKSQPNKVAWEIKPKNEEETKKIEVKEPAKPGVYVSAAFRTKNLPDIDSMDEFPSLDAVKQKPKKLEPAEPIDNSWTDVQRGPASRRREEQSDYLPPSTYRSDAPGRYASFAPRDTFSSKSGFPERSGNLQASSSSWTRGETIKVDDAVLSSSTNHTSGTFERRAGAVASSRPYVPPSQRGANPISQSNRFAQLDSS